MAQLTSQNYITRKQPTKQGTEASVIFLPAERKYYSAPFLLLLCNRLYTVHTFLVGLNVQH